MGVFYFFGSSSASTGRYYFHVQNDHGVQSYTSAEFDPAWIEMINRHDGGPVVTMFLYYFEKLSGEFYPQMRKDVVDLSSDAAGRRRTFADIVREELGVSVTTGGFIPTEWRFQLYAQLYAKKTGGTPTCGGEAIPHTKVTLPELLPVTFLDEYESGWPVYFDTETSGLHDRDTIIQWAMMNETRESFCALVRHTKEIHPRATAIHGLDASRLASEMPWPVVWHEDVYPRLLEWHGQRTHSPEHPWIFVAYNANFDRRMMLQTFKVHGMQAEIDCIHRGEWRFVDAMPAKKPKLVDVFRQLTGRPDHPLLLKAHDALADVKMMMYCIYYPQYYRVQVDRDTLYLRRGNTAILSHRTWDAQITVTSPQNHRLEPHVDSDSLFFLDGPRAIRASYNPGSKSIYFVCQ